MVTKYNCRNISEQAICFITISRNFFLPLVYNRKLPINKIIPLRNLFSKLCFVR